MSDPHPKDLIYAEDLSSKGNSKEALKIITNFEGTAWRYFLFNYQ